MSSRSDTITPQPDAEAISPSPARNALQGNLQSDLTLTRKKSWFGSARDWASKAKGYFDKHDGSKAENGTGGQPTAEELHGGERLSSELECSDDEAMEKPLGSSPVRRRTFTPKTAMASLRQHTLSTRGRHKRGALSDIHGPGCGPENEMAELCTPTHAENAPKGHGRKSSVAKSLVGSIRGLGKRTSAARTISPEKLIEQRESSSSSEDEAAYVPLPSSPINITPLPTLSLDLQSSSLVPDTFGRTPPDGDTELMRATDPRNIASARPLPTYYTRIPGESPVDQLNLALGSIDKTCSPRSYLDLRRTDIGPAPSPGPPTPMPGTNCSLELDGITEPAGRIELQPPAQKPDKHIGLDGANDETELFERNVEYKDETKKKENRTLKKMVSLDAMAEECAALSPSQRLSPSPRNVSDVTVRDCPDDMPELTRQWARLQTPSAGHRCPQTGDWKSEDPFAPGNAVGDLALDGPPASGAQVILPLRPKITLQEADGTEPRTLNDNDVPIVGSGIDDSAIPSYAPAAATANVQVCEWSDIEMPSHSNPAFLPDPANASTRNVTPIVAPEETSQRDAKAEMVPQRQPLTVDNDDNVSEHVVHEPSIDGSDQDSMHGPVERKSSVMQIYELLTKTQTPSPKRVAAGIMVSATHAPFWRLRPWSDSSPASKETPEDADDAGMNTPLRQQRERSASLEVEASDSYQSPGADSTACVLEFAESPTMGDRADFDDPRVERAKRYAALAGSLTGEDDTVVFDDMDAANAPSPLRPAKNETGMNEMASDSHNSPIHKARSRRDSGHASCYSVDSDLQADLAGIYELQNAISGTTFDPNPVVMEEQDPETPMPLSAQGLLSAEKDDRGEDEEALSTPALSPGETKFWRELQFGLDTPQQTPGESPTQSLHKRQCTAIIGEGPDEVHDAAVESALPYDADDEIQDMAEQSDEALSDPEQTLDEGLQLYHSFTSNPDIRYSDTAPIPDDGTPVRNSFAPLDSGYSPDSDSDAEDVPSSPSRYRNRKTTIAAPSH